MHPFRHAVDPATAGVVEGDELEQPLALGAAAVGARQPLMEGENLIRRVPAGKAKQLGEITELRAGCA